MTYYMKKKKEAELLKKLLKELDKIQINKDLSYLEYIIQDYKTKIWDIENEEK